MTLNQIISLIQTAPDRQVPNRARSMTKRQVAAWIDEVRGFLMSKSIEKEDSIPVTYQQDLGCWELQTVDQADCECPWIWGDNVKKLVIPEILELQYNAGILLFLIDKRTRIYLPDQVFGSLDDFTRFPGKGASAIQGQMIGTQTIYFKLNNTGNTPPIKVVNVRGVFKQPSLVDFYSAEGVKHCYDENMPYPIPMDMIGYMEDMIWKRHILPFANAPRDNTNQEKNAALV